MQGPRKSISTLPENLILDNDSTLRDSGIDSHHQTLRHGRWNAEWSLGESSSSRATLTMEERPYESSNIFALNNVDVNSNGNQATNGSFLLQNSSSIVLPHDLNMSSGFGDAFAAAAAAAADADDDDDDCQVVEPPSSYMSIRPSNEQMPSGSSGYPPDDMRGRSLDGRHVSRKRKAIELHAGQSSEVGSSNCFQIGVSSNDVPNDVVANNGSEQANPRFRPGVGEAISASDFSLSASGNEVSPRRNLRLRINGRHQQDSTPNYPLSTDIGITEVSSSRHSSRSDSRNHLFGLNPSPAVENGALLHGQSILHARRNYQSTWSGSSSSSTRNSISSTSSALYEEPTSRNTRRRISEHPMFVPATEMRNNSSQIPANLNLAGGSNIITGNAGSTSRVGPTTGSNRSFPRRLSEMVRRSLLSSTGTEYGGQLINHGVQSSSAADMALTAGPDNHGHRVVNSRSVLLRRHHDGALGVPYSVRNLAAAREGRSSIMSEQLRHVLDLMQRGEGLRIEDLMILDHSVLFGMADFRDRHRDMQLDVDNMSYEELLALEERIGNVCTGLSEETIMSRLEQHKHVNSKAAEDKTETEPCSICREEYNDGEDLGKLECGHDFHKDCIKQWLKQKNLCPICKTTGLTT